MIRLIKRKLIIPQGDTGEFTIPLQGTLDGGEAKFSIYDTLTRTNVLEKPGTLTPDGDAITFTFASKDTLKIEPDPNDQGGRYVWDVTLIRPGHDDVPESIDSYYAAFTLPTCVIKRSARKLSQE